jgi:hypothetical protein
MNRREALKVMGSSTFALCLFKDIYPTAHFHTVTFECPPKMYSIFGKGSTITQPQLINGDDILGEWHPEPFPNLSFDASILDTISPFPLPPCWHGLNNPAKNYLQRSSYALLNPDDGFITCSHDGKLTKFCGPVKITQVQFVDKEEYSQITGINRLPYSICWNWQFESDGIITT